MKWMILPIVAIMICGTAHAQGFVITPDKDAYIWSDIIVMEVIVPTDPRFGDEHDVMVYGPGGFVAKYPVTPGVNTINVYTDDIFDGNGEYWVSISYGTVVDTATFEISDGKATFDGTGSSAGQVGQEADTVDATGEKFSENVEALLFEIFKVMAPALNILFSAFGMGLVSLLIMILFLRFLIRRYKRKQSMGHVGGQNKGQSQKLRVGLDKRPHQDKKYSAQSGMQSRMFGIGIEKRYDTKTKWGGERTIPSTGDIVADTSALFMIKNGELDAEKIMDRIVVPDIVDSEFCHIMKKNGTGMDSIKWYDKSMIVDPGNCDNYIQEIDKIYKNVSEGGDNELARHWVNAKADYLTKNHGIHPSGFSDNKIMLEAAQVLYRESKSDRIIIAKAAAMDNSSCILSQDEDILLFDREISNMTDGRLRVVRADTLRPSR